MSQTVRYITDTKKITRDMKTLKFISVLVLSYMCTCNGTPIDDSPPESLKKHRVPLQRISDTGREVHIPPLAFLNEHSDLHEGFRDGGIHSFPEEETGRVHSILDAKSEELNNLEGARSNFDTKPTLQVHNQRLSEAEGEIGELVEDPVALNILRTYWTDLRSEMPDGNLQEPKGKNGLLWDVIINGLGGFYLPSKDESIVNNSQCISDVGLIYKPTGKSQWTYATALIDSWGKIPDGFLGGNTLSMGSFDECLLVKFPRNSPGDEHQLGSFKGQYCAVSYTAVVGQNSETPDDLEEVLPRLAPSIAIPGIPFMHFTMYGTCIPSSCTEEDFIVSLNHVLKPKNKTAGLVSCQTESNPTVDFTPGVIAMITVLSVLGCLLLGGAAVNIWIQYTGKEELRKGSLKYLLVFSFNTNLQKMFHINTSENKEAITCLYGMRVMSMTWVVWCHQYMMTNFNSGNKFLIGTLFEDHWMTQAIVNGYPSVDSFFFMSGLLVAYGVIKEKKRSGSVNILIFYVHRFLRLSVPILLLCGFLATFTEYLAHGPFAGTADDHNSLQDICQKNWWVDALFATNFVASTDPSCLGACWYTAVDFQLYLVAPIILFPFIWGDLIRMSSRTSLILGCVWLSIITLASALIPGIITVLKKFPPTAVFSVSFVDNALAIEQSEMIYLKPWCRAQPYLVGMWLAILLRSDSKKEIRLQMWQVLLGWLVAAGTGLAVVYGVYDYNQLELPVRGYHWADSFFYAAFSRLAWGCALGWVVFACHYGYGGPVNTFLSHPSWQPISRLTYCMFLVALPLQQIIFYYNSFYPTYFSHLNKVQETVSTLFMAGIGAVLLSLCTEAPVMGLEKLLLRRGTPK